MAVNRRDAIHLLPLSVDGQRKLRMVVLGASRVGKTQLVSRFIGKPFSDMYLPTVEDFHRKMYTIRGHTYQLDILDTAGTINPLNHKITLMTGDIFLIVYSVTEESSFEHAKELVTMVEEAKQSLHSDAMRNGKVKKRSSMVRAPIVIAGNKADLTKDRTVPDAAAADWLREGPQFGRHLCAHVDVSARDPASVQVLFERLFVLAHLPLEMSPNMHRKVSTHTFLEKTAESVAQHRKHNSPLMFNRSQSEDCSNRGASRKVWSSFKASRIHHHNNQQPHSPSGSSSSVSTFSSGSDEFLPAGAATDTPNSSPEKEAWASCDAVATLCPNQRRPSTQTEVNIALSKARIASAVPKCYGHSKRANQQVIMMADEKGLDEQQLQKQRAAAKPTDSALQRLRKKIIRLKSN